MVRDHCERAGFTTTFTFTETCPTDCGDGFRFMIISKLANLRLRAIPTPSISGAQFFWSQCGGKFWSKPYRILLGRYIPTTSQQPAIRHGHFRHQYAERRPHACHALVEAKSHVIVLSIFYTLLSRKLPLVSVKKVPNACVNLKDCVAERGMQPSTWFVQVRATTVAAMRDGILLALR